MRLTHISIENFRGITSLALRLDALTVVIGENNHGKTSLFDVLDRCLGERADGEDAGWEYRDFRRDPEGVAAPIRVVLAFERGGSAAPSLSDRLFETALVPGADGVHRLRVEFLGRPGSGAMETRLLDGSGDSVDVPSQEALLRRLRQLHPVLVVRLAQPPPDAELQWVSRSFQREFDVDDGDDPEEAIGRVYHRLTRTRGAIPTAEVGRGLQAARALRNRMAEGGRRRPGPVERMLDGFLDQTSGAGPAPMTGGGSHNLGLLMVLGSLLEARGGIEMPDEANPIIAIEEPEVHLHPMLLSSAWDVIQDLNAQTLVTTNSGELMSEIPLHHLRRLARRNGRIESFQLGEDTLSADALRRVAYHVRAKRGGILFARCWVLVEGETEYWLIRELGSVLGYDLEAEGVRCVEFAQCGVTPLLRVANDLGIRWHVLSDGDESGVAFANDAARQIRGGERADHVTHLERRNMEMLLFAEGFEDVYYRAAGLEPPRPGSDDARPSPRKVVARAIRAHSKPYLALMVAEEAARRGPDSVPPSLRHVIETSVRLAREAIEEG